MPEPLLILRSALVYLSVNIDILKLSHCLHSVLKFVVYIYTLYCHVVPAIDAHKI